MTGDISGVAPPGSEALPKAKRMTDASINLSDVLPFDRGRLSQRHSTWTVAAAGTLTLGVLVGSWLVDHRSAFRAAPETGAALLASAFRTPPAARLPALPEGPTAAVDPATARLGAAFRSPPAPAIPPLAVAPESGVSTPRAGAALLDPAFALGSAPASPDGRTPPLASRFVFAEASSPSPSAPPAEIALIAPFGEVPHDTAPVPEPSPAAAVAPPNPMPQIEVAPLPAPRPAFAAADPEPTRPPRRRMARNTDTAPTPVPAANGDDRGFFEKFFGMLKPSGGPALSYASPEDGLFGRGRAAISASPATPHSPYTAVYDISAHTVFMPDGARLEAHSGLGRLIDDPHFVHVRNSGPTPPAVYDLQLRESLFHGVQALRLNPVGSTVYGRTGLLAHTFMLGPNGDSNGCVSFRDYAAFLRAYQNGQVKRLVVVPGVG